MTRASLTSTAHRLIAAGAASLFALPALAEGGEHGGGHAAPHINWWGVGPEHAHAPALGWLAITFAIFLWLLYHFGKRPFKDMLIARHEAVKNALEEAAQAKAEAERVAQEYEERLAKLDDEIAALKREFVERGEAEAARLEALGKASAERVARDVADTIAADTERAQVQLRQEAARLALQMAEERITQAASDADEKRLRVTFLEDVKQGGAAA